MFALAVSRVRYLIVALVLLCVIFSFAYFNFEAFYAAGGSRPGGEEVVAGGGGGGGGGGGREEGVAEEAGGRETFLSSDEISDNTDSDTTRTRNALRRVLQYIYNPHNFTFTTPEFAHKGETYKLDSSSPRYDASLGKKICILDVDTRAFDEENQIFHSGAEGFEWASLEAHSGGIMNHYMYAQTHGYDYKFYRAARPTADDDRHATWVKVRGLADTLKNSHYKYVVFLDADALFNQMHIPMEWLLNYWAVNSTTSLAMALDPPGEINEDKQGRRYANTGFIIAQNNAKTLDILKAWDECPSESEPRYKGCGEWSKERFHEQSAYGEYIRYDYEEYLKELPCNEANGEWDLGGCKGVFVQHMWWRTETVKDYFGDRTLQALMGRMHAELMDQKGEFVETESVSQTRS